MTEIPLYPTPEREQDRLPATVTGSFWAFVATAVIGVVDALLAAGRRQAFVDAARHATPSLTDAQIQQAATFAIAAGMVFTAIISLLYLLFAFKVRAGRNWARIVLVIGTVLRAIPLATGNASVTTYLATAVAVVGVVLFFLPASNEYFAAVKGSHHRG